MMSALNNMKTFRVKYIFSLIEKATEKL